MMRFLRNLSIAIALVGASFAFAETETITPPDIEDMEDITETITPPDIEDMEDMEDVEDMEPIWKIWKI